VRSVSILPSDDDVTHHAHERVIALCDASARWYRDPTPRPDANRMMALRRGDSGIHIKIA
jgi:hypothetical protein